MLFTAIFFLCLSVFGQTAHIKVGIYNAIPDLDDDGLESYKRMIEEEFKDRTAHTVDAVVDPNEYNPYSNSVELEDLLDEFDVLEIDTTSLEKLAQMNRVIVKTEEVEATFNWTDVFPASEKAVIIGEEKYAYPTLVFGNFIHAITPAALPDCPISSGTASFSEYETALEICKSNLMGEWSDYERLVSGKMIDQDGWYQPYIYLDGYVDLHGAENLQQGLEDLMNGVVDDTLCERLKWFTGLCHHNDSEPQNLCLDTTSDVATFIDDVVDHKGVLLYSSPEKLPLAVKKMEGSHRMIHGLGAVSMGNENVLLQFTESLVVSGDRWDEASSRKQSAIREFIEMFTSLQMRYNISSGFDLETPQNRYLLMPLMSFYSETDAADNPIYSDASDFLQNAIPAPPLEDPTTLHETLMSKCINIDNDSGKKTKSEL